MRQTRKKALTIKRNGISNALPRRKIGKKTLQFEKGTTNDLETKEKWGSKRVATTLKRKRRKIWGKGNKKLSKKKREKLGKKIPVKTSRLDEEPKNKGPSQKKRNRQKKITNKST